MASSWHRYLNQLVQYCCKRPGVEAVEHDDQDFPGDERVEGFGNQGEVTLHCFGFAVDAQGGGTD